MGMTTQLSKKCTDITALLNSGGRVPTVIPRAQMGIETKIVGDVRTFGDHDITTVIQIIYYCFVAIKAIQKELLSQFSQRPRTKGVTSQEPGWHRPVVALVGYPRLDLAEKEYLNVG
jgi:hypothetical protein